ncbi:hypothetical protein PVE_R2G0786 [Pseudomonas veronii 1YdBTEX2]|uniref:Morphogenetic protein n=1 Tax=Pseudomonas veronii 1YdBTEX2 TaxID=1295141 RepID=A0A1D3K9E1_PSEVE|nr:MULTISPECIES: hypothetical protein [Pseudomonas]NWD57153.1 hypothetical protein [Pseudomonas veronii]OEC68244.1 hypothetical protein A7D21_27285 [Pseudomonas sp. AP19]SBW84811.1 hypothetical protein PVE_R2G0786 [Pseudomonas veronii 1YdBTEX2]
MKELPILFNGEMVRAILAGLKTVTRRAVKVQPISKNTGMVNAAYCGKPDLWLVDGSVGDYTCNGLVAPQWTCPYGRPGDRLWVRETTEADEQTSDVVILSRYSADRAPVLYSGCEDPDYNDTVAHWDYPRRSRPSIHMHRWASRILLEITAIRAERLHQMKTIDYQAEGCHGGHGSIPGYIYNATPCEHFHHVWDSTGGDWKANPWVWVVEFRRVESGCAGVTQVEAA